MPSNTNNNGDATNPNKKAVESKAEASSSQFTVQHASEDEDITREGFPVAAVMEHIVKRLEEVDSTQSTEQEDLNVIEKLQQFTQMIGAKLDERREQIYKDGPFGQRNHAGIEESFKRRKEMEESKKKNGGGQ